MSLRPQYIMVHPDERELALECGWQSEDILAPTVVQVEGLRWSAIHVTYQALEVIVFSRILDTIMNDQVRFDSIVTLGMIPNKPAVRVVKDFRLMHISADNDVNAFGYGIEIHNPSKEGR